MGALLKEALDAYSEVFLHERGAQHNDVKLTKPLPIFSVQSLDIELGYNFSGALSVKHVN